MFLHNDAESLAYYQDHGVWPEPRPEAYAYRDATFAVGEDYVGELTPEEVAWCNARVDTSAELR